MLRDDDLSSEKNEKEDNILLHEIINVEQRFQDADIRKRQDEVRKKIIDSYLRQKNS